MRYKGFLGMVLTLSLLAGCAGTQQVEERPLANGPPAPTPTADTGAPQTAPPPGISEIDSRVASLIHQTLKEDPSLAPAAKDLSVKVEKGVVTLRGSVPTAQDQAAVVDRISKLPGVDQVNDQLKVGSQ